MTIDNILVVAPYNAQVNLLKAMLPAGARVGTIDKFQGQEAEAVIVSMTSSNGDCLPRNIEFLYDKNRLNVAVSRAKCLAIVVASPDLLDIRCNSPEQMELVNTLCWLREYADALDARLNDGSHGALLPHRPAAATSAASCRVTFSSTSSRFRSRRSSAISSTCATASTRRSSTIADAGGYRYDKQSATGPRFALPGLWFTESEAFALVMMEHLLSSLDQGGLIGPHIAPLRARLTAILGTGEASATEVRRAHPPARVLAARAAAAVLRGNRPRDAEARADSRRLLRTKQRPGLGARRLAAASRSLPRQLVPRRLVPSAQ